MSDFAWWGWAIMGFSALAIGFSKTGMPGAAIMAIPLMTCVVPAVNCRVLPATAQLKLLKVVPPEIAAAAALTKLTVPVPAVRLPAVFVQLRATDMFRLLASSVPEVRITSRFTVMLS